MAYLLWVLSWISLLLTEKYHKFVKYHAIQSIALFAVLVIINISATIIYGILFFIPYMGWLVGVISGLISLGEFALWIFLMYKAYNHEKFKLPYIGDIAEQKSM